jgi:hypothetical protein
VNRSDERKQMSAGMGRVSKEHDDPERQVEEEGAEDASMARSPAAARKAEAREMKDEHEEEGHDRDVVRGGREIKRESVEADHVIGTGGKVGTSSAEGEPDMASAKANRKEAMEPEREEQEKAAMGRERTVAHKNTISWGERETVAKHTI